MKITENVPIKELTTMRLGGPARYVLEVNNPSEIPKAYEFAKSKNLPIFILGGGANTIARDEGFNGVIVRYTKTGIIFAGDRNASFEGSKTWASAPERPEEEMLGQDPLLIFTPNDFIIWHRACNNREQ